MALIIIFIVAVIALNFVFAGKKRKANSEPVEFAALSRALHRRVSSEETVFVCAGVGRSIKIVVGNSPKVGKSESPEDELFTES